MGVRCKGREKPRGETGQGVHQQEEPPVEAHESLGGQGVLVEPGGLESDWWPETWRRGTERIMCRNKTIVESILLTQKKLPIIPYLPPELPRCTCSQESSTGGGMVVLIVVVLMSPMMLSASRRAWYMRSISSRCWACS